MFKLLLLLQPATSCQRKQWLADLANYHWVKYLYVPLGLQPLYYLTCDNSPSLYMKAVLIFERRLRAASAQPGRLAGSLVSPLQLFPSILPIYSPYCARRHLYTRNQYSNLLQHYQASSLVFTDNLRRVETLNKVHLD